MNTLCCCGDNLKILREMRFIADSRFRSIFFLCLLLLSNGACTSRQAVEPNKGSLIDKSDPVLVVRANVDALQRKDLAAVVATLDPEDPLFEQTKKITASGFKNYEFRYALEDVALESMSDDEARVRFVQVTKKVSGPAFRDNRVEGVHTLRKRNGEWKMFHTETTKIEYLDK